MDADFAASLRAKKAAAAKKNEDGAEWQRRQDQLDIAIERLRGVCSRPDIQSAIERPKLVSVLLEFGRCCREIKIADRVQLLSPKSNEERFVVDVVNDAIEGREDLVSKSLRMAGEDFLGSDLVTISNLLGDVGWRMWQCQPLGRHNTMENVRDYFALQDKHGDTMVIGAFRYWREALTDEAKAWRAVHEYCFQILQPKNMNELWSSILTLMERVHHVSADQFWKMKPGEVAELILPKESDLPEWMADLTHDKLLEQCFKLKREWLLPGIGAVFDPPNKIRELRAGLALLRIATPLGLPTLPTLVELITTGDEQKHHDDFCTSVDLIIAAIENSRGLLPPRPDRPLVAQGEYEILSQPTNPKSDWPPDDGWHFRPGEAAFRRVTIPITGAPADVLATLAKNFGQPVPKETLLATMPVDSNATQANWLRDNVSKARKAIRRAFGLGAKVDPIVNIEKGSGLRGGWRLDSEVFPAINE